MKQRLQILNDPRFHLVYGVTQRFTEAPFPSKVRLNREGRTLASGIKKKVAVHPGMLLAEHPSLEKGDLFSPIHGVITDINERSIFVSAADPDPDAPQVEPVDLISSDIWGQELVVRLKKMGLNTRSLGQRCKTLIINGLNPDPGVTWAEPMLLSHVPNMEVGLELLHRIGWVERFILAVPTGMHVSYQGVEVVQISPEYPMSLDPMVKRAVTGQENPADVGIVGLHNLWSLGRVGRTGLPLTETVITIGNYTRSHNYIVKEGSTIGELLQFADIPLHAGDTVVRGGPLRGEAIDRLDRSVTKGSTGVFVVDAGAIPPMKGHSPCVNCGACVMVCPSRLNPCTLSRYAEFAHHESCRRENIDCCMGCGLCGYVCPARRPVLQYIRLAQAKLREIDRNRQLVEITPVPHEQDAGKTAQQ